MKKSRYYRYLHRWSLATALAALTSAFLPLLFGPLEAGGHLSRLGTLADFVLVAGGCACALLIVEIRTKFSGPLLWGGALFVIVSALMHALELTSLQTNLRGFRWVLLATGCVLLAPALPRQTPVERILRLAVLLTGLPVAVLPLLEPALARPAGMAGRLGLTAAGLLALSWIAFVRSRGRHIQTDPGSL